MERNGYSFRSRGNGFINREDEDRQLGSAVAGHEVVIAPFLRRRRVRRVLVHAVIAAAPVLHAVALLARARPVVIVNPGSPVQRKLLKQHHAEQQGGYHLRFPGEAAHSPDMILAVSLQNIPGKRMHRSFLE